MLNVGVFLTLHYKILSKMDKKINLSHLPLFRFEIKIKNRFFLRLLFKDLGGQKKINQRKGVPEGTPKKVRNRKIN